MQKINKVEIPDKKEKKETSLEAAIRLVREAQERRGLFLKKSY